MSDEENDNCVHIYEQDFLENVVFQEVEETPTFKSTSCCSFLEKNNLIRKLGPYSSSIKKDADLSCIINMIRNFLEAVEHIGNFGEKEQKYFSVDLFLRFRHDFLHNFCMCVLNLPEKKTDERFCDVFDFMDSKRSPDRIIVDDKFVMIIETTATSDVKKSFITKGKIDEGFKSKYEKEISILSNNDYIVEYSVIIFDMKDSTNFSYQSEIKRISKLLNKEINKEELNKLEMIRTTFCNKSSAITKMYSIELQNLLTEHFSLDKPALTNIDFLLESGESENPDYSRITVSTAVYSKITNVWSLFPHILSRCERDEDCLYVPNLDHSTNKFTFIKNNKGVKFDEMMNMLIDNDKPQFTKLLVQTFEGRPITFERSDIEFFEKVNKDNKKTILIEGELIQYMHPNSQPFLDEETPPDFSSYVNVEYYKNIHHLYEDRNYEEKLINALCKFYKKSSTFGELDAYFDSLGKTPFCRYRLNEGVIDEAVKSFNEKMLILNNEGFDRNIIKYQKQPFIHALSSGADLDYMDYRETPITALKVLNIIDKGDYTANIYRMINSDNFTWGSRKSGVEIKEKELLSELKNVQSRLYKIQLDIRKEKGKGPLPKLREIEGYEDLKNELSLANSRLASVRGPRRSKISQVRLPTKKNSIFGKAFMDEMEHFKKKKTSAFYKGVGLLDFNRLSVDFDSLKLASISPTDKKCPDEIYFDHASIDAPLLQKLKVDYLDEFRSKYDFLRRTSLYSSCSFVSRLCHSLAFYSQTSTGSDYCSVDNLGYKNVILIVKGGKKIFKTKKTKLFRLLYPINKEISNWYKSPDFRSSCSLTTFEGVSYVLTSWQTLDEVILNDGLTFLHRTMSYLLLSHERSISKSFNKNFFNIMLAFHSRRKTEELLHNLRYICVNSISNISRLDLMLPELADFNYDFFQAYIRSCLSENYSTFSKILFNYNKAEKVGKDYFKKANLKSIFDRCEIENLEDLTVTIYSTFLMSKSPTNQALEQVRNLKNMLETKEKHHFESSDDVKGQYDKNAVIIKSDDIGDYWNNLFKSDFNFDPAYCNLLGKFSGNYMNNIISKGEINSKWMNIVNETWDDFANTKGLRGEGKKFFNRKGYYIVYEEIIKNTDILENIKKLLMSNEDDFTKRKILNNLNCKYKSKLGCKNMSEAVFHVVDKKQRGGSREIFVMDLETKINQQAIEKFLSYFCKKVPNEAISVPSNKRLQHIHANVFEKFKRSELKSYNATLDCRKWAPHSVINKFIDFIIGMSGFLPDSFVTHFLCFFSKMFTKKVYTRKSIKEILLTNESTKDKALKFLVDEDKFEGAYMVMSYSWVMGIFNYMSSFMHVMNQLHASHIIRKVTSNCEREIVYYHMNAHSDDSGGKIQAPDEISMVKTFFIYELLLKSCNHLLSDKKCNISLRYFEFLSILYISNTLLSLISKISGSFNFHPTDTGYCGDVNECYSKCIEMISLGATFDQAYLSMKISSHLIFKFYFNRNPTISDHLLPPQLLGIPDSHPIITLISGSDSDVIRLTYNDPEKFQKFLFISKFFNTTNEINDDIIKPIKVNPNIRKSDELIEHSENIQTEELNDDLKWIIKNLNTKNTGLKLMKYGYMLNDKKFISALIDETVTRRISRAFHFRDHQVIPTPVGVITYKIASLCINFFMFGDVFSCDLSKEFLDCLREANDVFNESDSKNIDNFNTYELMNFEVFGFMKSISSINYTKEDIIDSSKTCKPIHINMQKTGLPTTPNFDPTELCIWIKFPHYRWMINLADDYSNKFIQIKNYFERHGIDIEKLEPNWLYSFLQKLKMKYVKEYFIYSNLPADIRDISNFQDFLNFLAHNSFKNKYIQGITAPLGVTISQPLSLLFKGNLDKGAIDVITFINFCFSLAKDFLLFKEVSDLKIDSNILGCTSDKLYDLVSELISKWELKGEYSSLIVPHLWSIKNKMDGCLYSAPWLEQSYYYSFTKSQKLIGNVWLGKGMLYVNTPSFKCEMELLNGRINSICGNKKQHTFTTIEISFINSVLMNANLPKIEDHFENVDYTKWESLGFGCNSAGLMCIDQLRNLKLSISNYNFLPNILNIVSKPGICSVRLEKNFSYKFEYVDEIYGNKTYNVNVLKISPSEMLELITKLYDTEQNKKIVEKRGEYFEKYLKMFIGNVSGAELRIDQSQFFDLLQSTRIYAILSDLANKDIISNETLKPRKHVYPGQSGGLLSCLMDYKRIDDSFDFDYNLILSPEMMTLKSSQPESFITNLVENIRDKYNSLYSSMDKDIIRKELIKLSDIVNEDKSAKSLMGLLMNWGYIGIMGSLEEMLFVKKAENYSGIRLNLKESIYSKLNLTALKNLLTSIYRSAEESNYFSDLEIEKNHFCCTSIKDLQKVLISYVHSLVLSSYEKNVNTFCLNSIEFIKLSETIKLFMQKDEFNEILGKNFEKDLLLSLLPVERSNFKDIMIMLQTLTVSVSQNLGQKHKLDFSKPHQHDHDLIRPFTVTKEILSETPMKFRISTANYHGFISRERLRMFQRHHFKSYKNELYDVNFSLKDPGDQYLPFNKYLFMNKKVKDESIEDEDNEFADVFLELESEDPDVETFNEDFLEEHFSEDYPRVSKVQYKGESRFANRLDVSVILLPQLAGSLEKLDYVRNISQTLMIITNYYIPDLVEYMNENVKIFHFCNDGWENFSLIDPSCLLAYVIDSKPINTDMFSKLFNMHLIDKVKLFEYDLRSPGNTVVDEFGNKKLLRKYSSLEDKLNFFRSEEKPEEESEEKELTEGEFNEEIDEMRVRLKEKGFGDEMIEEIKKYKKEEPKPKNIEEFYKKVFSKLKKSNILQSSINEGLKNKIKDLLENLEDFNQAQKIFEVANVFSTGPPIPSNRRNRSLKDEYLRAELNCLALGAVDLILSGRLVISKSLKSEFIKHCKAMRKWALSDKQDREKKLFLIDLSHLIVNDAFFDSETNNDDIFRGIMSTLTNFIVTDDDDDEDYNFLDTYRKKSRLGRLYYGF